ncbi:hypothetical protein [Bosea sp. (in: a-proteobacteria)]|uniref:hypothetical protein n=1 Tax=Bosea sp. (in: a-proteobacteria) TaxID=1871050 RepID=UPI002DDCB6F3|nr:hypothetical protein [Bosea sp. (in: a-proteobacteria)]HEV2509724.1 hypothetical protein [Bosea sp. (in: a-proteobacteria)]
MSGAVWRSSITSPTFWIAAFLAMVILGLALPIRLPLGPNYWDTDIYLDAAQRIRQGQVPNIDFFTSIGPLGFYLTAGIKALFPQAQPALLANWAIVPISLPIAALIAWDIGARSRKLALAIVIPFLVLTSLPINLHSLYPSPGFDGFGYYNRHVALLLYLLLAALLFVESRALLTTLVAVLMVALFLVKVTGPVSGAALVGYAVLAGRMRFRDAAIAAGAVIACLGLIELATGLVFAYLEDILDLAMLNSASFLRRFLTLGSIKFNVIAPCLALIGVLAYAARRDRLSQGSLLTSPLGWLGASLFALVLGETQNSGSLEFIGLWPVLILILKDYSQKSGDQLRPWVLMLVMAVSLPSAVIFLERGARAVIAAPRYQALEVPDVGPLGRVSLKPELAERAVGQLEHYVEYYDASADLVRRGLLPSATLFSEIDHQATWLLEVQQGVDAIKRWEATNRRQLNGFFALDFVSPFNHLLGRAAPLHVALGIDTERTNPKVTREMLEALRDIDAIMRPKCPYEVKRAAIWTQFAQALEGRQLISLSPCWDMYLRKQREP